MNHQLGPGFANYFIIPRMKQIFDAKNIESDERLQVLLSFKGMLEPEQITGLKQDYFYDWTGTVMDDQANKDIFWDMLITYVGYIKQVSNDSAETLAAMMLPGEKGLSKEAANRYSFFCFLFTKTLEKKFIEEEIAKQDISDTEKNKLRDQNSKEELILVRKKGKGSPFGIVSKDQIEKAQQSEDGRGALMGGLFTQEGVEGTQVVLMNPPQDEEGKAKPGKEQGSNLIGMIKSIWESLFRKVREVFKEAKLDITGKVSIDSTGVVKFYVTKGRTKMLVEFSASKPIGPDGRNYKFTFVDQPAKHFWANDKDVKDYFVQQDLSPEQVHKIKIGGESKSAGGVPPTGAPLPMGGRSAEPRTPRRGAVSTPIAGSTPKMPLKTEMPSVTTPEAKARAGVAGGVTAAGSRRVARKGKATAKRKGGVMGAKQAYQEGRKGNAGAQTEEKGRGTTQPQQPKVAAARRRRPRKQMNPLKRVAVITGGAGAAVVGGSFFTLFFT
ncbi:hypothetical protein ACFL3C_03420 [Patescibacteria group bacterium]